MPVKQVKLSKSQEIIEEKDDNIVEEETNDEVVNGY